MIVSGRAVLEITMKSHEDCQVIVTSLLPDERELPQGVSSTIRCINDKLIYEIVYSVDSDRLLSIYNTIDDFIRNLRIVMESLNRLGR